MQYAGTGTGTEPASVLGAGAGFVPDAGTELGLWLSSGHNKSAK